MKNIYRIGILCTIALAVSCTGVNKADEDWGTNPHVKKTVPAETRTLTFALPQYPMDDNGAIASGFKTAWEVGDKIIVHGEYADEQVTVTLEADDISEDKKTATKTVEGLHPYTRDDCHSSLYAAYPAEAVNNLPHCMFYTSFGNTNTQIMAACNREDLFRFQNLSSLVTFVVSGDFDSYTFTGRKDVMLSYDLYQVKITDTDVNMKQYLQNPSTTITSNKLVADGKTVNYVYIPGDVDLPGGVIIRFYKGGEAVKSLTDKDAFIIKRGTRQDLGDVTAHLVDAADDIDPSLAKPLDGNGRANCYVAYESGFYRFNAVRGNSNTPIEGISEADIVWETYNNGEEVAARSVVSGIAYDEETGSVCFEIPSPIRHGNALLAVKDDDNNILWSWHIWIPKTTIEEGSYGYSSSVTMMDRNLGALVTADTEVADPQSSGMYYQWGRKDPLRAVGSFTEAVAATTAPAGIWTSEAKQGTLLEARQHPTVMYLNEIWTSDMYADLWAEAKTENDPCPPGWKIPINKGIFEGYWSSMTLATDSWGKYGFKAGAGSSSTSVFPYSGAIDYTSGDFDFFDSESGQFKGTRLWDAVAYSKAGYYRALQIRNDQTHNGTGYAMGFAHGIRCIAE